ncbi:lytic murein transglycosylase [Marinobacter fonticola]|uniref:lytic murein transglycosylase n=1 Tax=Marinobacter fonticola TaxID=2603215 RepID=UPI001D0D883E
MKRGTSAVRRLAPWLAAISLAAPYTLAQETTQPTSQADFGQCIGQLKDRALKEGVSPEVAQNVLDQVTFLDRVIELDRRQPEFTTTFADYLNRRVNEARIDKGRELLNTHAELLAKVSRETGVPAPYLVAFWGLETNFGSYFGKMSVPSALATLACDPRRSDYFSGELISALRIIDEGAIAPEQMEGSWAGAMGHVQFMPSVFLRYAVDADNDGKRDLWNSIPDAMMSAGNFLQSLGWNGDYRWGREVQLPPGFDYSLAGLKRERTLSEWRKLDVRDAFGKPLPQAAVDAALLVPAGHEGPAFLVYHNFHVIMGWNRSEYYALAVGHLADRIAGAGGLQNPPPEDLPRLSREDIEALQAALNQRGYDSGEPDGILGPATRSAIRDFQKDQKRIADGYPDPGLFEALDIKLQGTEAS